MKGVTPHAVHAAIYQVATGVELRILHHGEIQETQLSRTGEQPLIERAERLKALLLEQGWTEVPQKRR